MPTFRYAAIDERTGKRVKGKLTAANELDLEDRLGDLGLVVLNSATVKERKSRFFGKISDKELIMFCVHMEQLDKAGVPILDSLADLRDSADTPAFRDVMADIYESVKSGDMLSASLAKRSDVFDHVFVGLVLAGEQTGRLSEAFGHLAHHFKWSNDLKRSVKKATRYPVVLLVVMTGVISLMMLFVVPKLVDFLTAQGFDLPIHTRALIATSAAMADYWYLIFGIPTAILITLILLYKKTFGFRYFIDKIALKTPFIGHVILKINLSRFTHFFAVTFSSGIGALECLATARGVVSNLIIKEAVEQVITSVSEGSSLTRAISDTKKFPNLVVRMFKVGEDSGNMDESLKNVNFFFDREVEDSVNGLIGMIQPALTLVMGVLMLWVIAAVFGPLYDSFRNIDF